MGVVPLKSDQLILRCFSDDSVLFFAAPDYFFVKSIGDCFFKLV